MARALAHGGGSELYNNRRPRHCTYRAPCERASVLFPFSLSLSLSRFFLFFLSSHGPTSLPRTIVRGDRRRDRDRPTYDFSRIQQLRTRRNRADLNELYL